MAFHLIHGDDDFQRLATAKALVDKLCPEAERQMNLEIIDGQAANADEVEAVFKKLYLALASDSLFGGAKTIWLRDGNFFGSGGAGRSQAAKDAVAGFVDFLDKQIGGSSSLILQVDSIAKNTRLYKWFKKNGEAHEFVVPQKSYEADASAKDFIAQVLKEEDVQCASDVLALLVLRIGADRWRIRSELDKLFAYIGDHKKITREDVLAVVSPGREALMWDLADAVAQKNLNAALQQSQRLLSQKIPAFQLLRGIYDRLQDLLFCKDCMAKGWLHVSGSGRYAKAVWELDAEAEAQLEGFKGGVHKYHPYRAKQLATQAMGWSDIQLKRQLQRIYKAYERLLSTSFSDELLLDLVLLDLLRPSR